MAEVEPKGFLSIENTLWRYWPLPEGYGKIGFQGGKVYNCTSTGGSCQAWGGSSYIDLPGIAFLSHYRGYMNALLFPPLGIGIAFTISTTPVLVMLKVSDSWTPPGQIMSIQPNKGKQDSTFSDIQLTCRYTTFEDDDVGNILFHIPDGLTVSNIVVISNTEIEFDLDIAINAPVGTKGISVVFDDGIDDGIDYLYNSEVVFEVTEKTN
jgi:hypothetical protein